MKRFTMEFTYDSDEKVELALEHVLESIRGDYVCGYDNGDFGDCELEWGIEELESLYPEQDYSKSLTYLEASASCIDSSEECFLPSKEFGANYKGQGFEVTFNYSGDIDSIRTVNPEGPSYWHDICGELTEQEQEVLDNIEDLEFQFLCDCKGNIEVD